MYFLMLKFSGSLSPALGIPEVGRSEFHLGKLDGGLVALPVKPVDTL